MIALFWLAHHSTFRYIKAIDRPLMLLNLLFLGVIAFLPFPTELLSASSSSQAPGVVFYAACAGSAGLFETLAWYYAMRAGLVEGLDESSQRLFLLRAARVPLVFGISIAIAQFEPRAAIYLLAGPRGDGLGGQLLLRPLAPPGTARRRAGRGLARPAGRRVGMTSTLGLLQPGDLPARRPQLHRGPRLGQARPPTRIGR